MRNQMKVVLFTILLGVLLVACSNPTAPTSIGPDSQGVNRQTGTSASSSDSKPAAKQVKPLDVPPPPDFKCGNPTDLLSDDSALQACLDAGGEIKLHPGSPGYVVNGLNGNFGQGLILNRSGTVLTSSAPPLRATIIAGRDLFSHILATQPFVGANNFSISFISFNGMVDEVRSDGAYRRARDTCFDPGGNFGNLFLEGNDFKFFNNESTHAMCGSGLGILGSRFKIENNYIAHNGRDRFTKNFGGVPWSDGMTVLSCEGGYIARNVIVDNTDIDLVVGGGRNCVVELNKIAHYGKYAFAGLNVGNFNDRGNHVGSEFRENIVYSATRNRLSIGILVGSHPWTSKVDVRYAGKVYNNIVHGSVINLVVDGVYGGEVVSNKVFDNNGDQGLGDCGDSLNYAVHPPHVSNTTLQSGWISYQYDGDIACGFNSVRNLPRLIR